MKKKELFMKESGRETRPVVMLFHVLMMAAVIAGVFWLSLAMLDLSFDFSFLGQLKSRIGKGFLLTLGISVSSFVLSLIIGIASVAGQRVRFLFVRYCCVLYVTFMRGTPLIMQIYLFYYIIGTAWGIENRLASGIIILSLFEGAYIAEIIRGSLLTLDESQLEAARAVGFTRRQRVVYVILPQVIVGALPALTGQFASIIKDSSLLSMIAVIELTQTMKEISSANYRLFECYLILGALYLVMTLPVTFVSKKLEKRFDYAN